MKKQQIGAVIRGEYVTDCMVTFGGRGGGIEFDTPDPHKIVGRLPLGNPARMSDLYDLSVNDILDYLEELGKHLDVEKNAYLQEAMEKANLTSSQTPPLVRTGYRSIPGLFDRGNIREIAQERIGIDYLDGWVERRDDSGRLLSIRAFGARAIHIIAGNSPTVGAISVIRNAITRSDMIIKSPSNDPFTAVALARTMIDMAPDHPITKHISIAYWKGGDEAVEGLLYRPHVVEKIVAWGGYASVKHITKYLQPGIDLITLEPKRSISVIGPEAFRDEKTQKEVAFRLAVDIGVFNQEGCLCSRVAYVLCGTDDDGLRKINAFGQQVYDALINLPEFLSTKPKWFSSELKSSLNGARLNDDWYNVIGGEDNEGAIIVSQTPEPVEFATALTNRVANLVPLDEPSQMFGGVSSYTQTVGVYPESLKVALRNELPIYGAQRLTTLGYAAQGTMAAPQDGIEPLRRMCKWIITENCTDVSPHWKDGKFFRAD